VILRRVDYGTPLKVMAGFALLAATFFFLYPHLPYVLDWSIFAQLPEHWRDPFAVIGFSNPPWAIFFLPHALLPLRISMAINASLNVVMLVIANRKFGGGLWGLVLILTSSYFLMLIANDNLDWLPLLGVMLPPQWGLILLSVKPQALAGIALIWVKKHGLGIFVPVLAVFAASLFLWPGWPIQWLSAAHALYGVRFFPWLVPLGIVGLWLAWRKDDESLAAASTCCLMPYFGLYSLAPVIAVLGKHRKIAMALWVAGWGLVILRIK
jgi:hypothetical protein